jgi:hypothetical protein
MKGRSPFEDQGGWAGSIQLSPATPKASSNTRFSRTHRTQGTPPPLPSCEVRLWCPLASEFTLSPLIPNAEMEGAARAPALGQMLAPPESCRVGGSDQSNSPRQRQRQVWINPLKASPRPLLRPVIHRRSPAPRREAPTSPEGALLKLTPVAAQPVPPRLQFRHRGFRDRQLPLRQIQIRLHVRRALRPHDRHIHLRMRQREP